MRQHDIFYILNLYIQDVKMGYPPHAFFRSQKCFFGPRNLSLRQTKSEFWDLRYTKNIEALLLALPNMCCSYCYKTLVLFAAYLLPCFLAFCAFSFFILYHSTAIVIVVKFCECGSCSFWFSVFFFWTLAIEFLAFVTNVIVPPHVMARNLFFKHPMLLDVFILFVSFSQNAWGVFFCIFLDTFVFF